MQTAYESMRFRDALRDGFYELQISRDTYRDMCIKLDVVSGQREVCRATNWGI